VAGLYMNGGPRWWSLLAVLCLFPQISPTCLNIFNSLSTLIYLPILDIQVQAT
jgi:hypothetical protein